MSYIKSYFEITKDALIDLKNGYLFRVEDKKSKRICDRPVTSTSMTDRLKRHLKSINLYEGETSHSNRRGCSIVLKMLGVEDEDICNHIGWHSKATLNHYTTEGRVANSSQATTALANAAENLDKGTSTLDKISVKIASLKNLKSS